MKLIAIIKKRINQEAELTHQFIPTIYFNTFGIHPPVLRIASGDEVSTSMVDAHGFNQKNEKVSNSPNPQTGPFFIEGALPGDQLAVEILDLEPNRKTAWTYAFPLTHLLSGEMGKMLPQRIQVQWSLDLENRSARRDVKGDNLDNFSLPIQPVLGCIGVAPENEAEFSTSTCGSFGGNMDHKLVRAGATIYLPVFVPGGLLFLGDGHASQSIGEISGAGLETSCNIRFRVSIIKSRPIESPRGENPENLFTFGNDRPFELAIQKASSGMVQRLQEEMALTFENALELLSQLAEYEPGNLVSAAFTVACKINKATLHLIKGR